MLRLPRWLWLNHVPAGLDLSPQQQADLRRQVRAMRGGKVRAPGIGKTVLLRLVPATAALSLLFVAWVLWLVGARLPGVGFAIAHVLGIILFLALTWVIIAWSINRAMAPLVWRALNDIGLRVCIECGYILEHLPPDQPNCPECGAGLHPPVKIDEGG